MNIEKIAELAGVSRATVSRFLNNGYVSEEKRKKIQEVIKKTGYIPSSQAQTLRTKKSNLIGVIVPKISSESVSRMVDGITKQLEDTGYHILLGNTSLSTQRELDYLKIFKNNRVDGVIFVATVLTKAHEKLMKALNLPLVVLGQQAEGYPCVFHDDFHGAFCAVERMLHKGARKIAFLGVTEEDRAAGYYRREGYMQALRTAGLQPDLALMKTGTFSAEFGYTATRQLLAAQEFDALFCATDTIASGAMKAMQQARKQPGKDLLLISVGDSQMAQVLTPTLSSVHLHYHTAGKEAAKLLLEKINGETDIIKTINLSCVLTERESSACLKNK